MAKENMVFLAGRLISAPTLFENKSRGRYQLETLRRNDKQDTPIVALWNDKMIQKAKNFEPGDFILVKGVLTTRDVTKQAYCKHCSQKVRFESSVTEVVAIDHYTMGKEFSLEDLKEISNTVILLGSLCRDVTTRMMPSGILSAQYQLAVNRKYRVDQQTDLKTDYPWVVSFAKQAEQDKVRLQTGSQVLIQGGLQTRTILRQLPPCPYCEGIFQIEDQVAEVVPYSVEYLNNCKFEEGEENN